MTNKDPLTPEQWAAARMLTARLRSEAVQEDFSFEDLGIEWLITDDVICARTDMGDDIRLGDLFYASIVMLWSMIVSYAADTGQHPLHVVGQLGIGLAQNEPTPPLPS